MTGGARAGRVKRHLRPRDGVAVVIQSYLGYEPGAVRKKLRAFSVVT